MKDLLSDYFCHVHKRIFFIIINTQKVLSIFNLQNSNRYNGACDLFSICLAIPDRLADAKGKSPRNFIFLK